MHAFETQKPAPAAKEEKEPPDVELRKKDEPEVGPIPDIEFKEAEKL